MSIKLDEFLFDLRYETSFSRKTLLRSAYVLGDLC